MRIERIGWNKPAVVVLGAGATRGASHVGKRPGPLPPLDADFFTQAQRLSQAKPRKLVSGLIADTVGIFGSNFEVTLEGMFTQVEHLSHVFDDYKLQGRPADNPYPAVRGRLVQVLAAVIDEAIGRNASCDHHRQLLDVLDHRDTVLTFNYDLLFDMTLRDHAPDKWNPRVGYGLPARINGPGGAGTRHWAGVDPATGDRLFPDQTITLLKMHGSLNWFPVPKEAEFSRLELRQKWWHQHGNLDFEIVPPEWNKASIRRGIYQMIWRQARKALKDVRTLAFIGYSLPSSDLPAQCLFMVDALKKKAPAPTLQMLVIVNPDKQARARIRRVLAARLDEKTRIITFDTLGDFASFLSL